MRLLLLLGLLFYSFKAHAQNCTPSINVSINVCGIKLGNDSLCPACKDCAAGLSATDSSLTIMSYTVAADGPGFDEGVGEAFNTGAGFNEARRVLSKVRPGSYVAFSCIKARDKYGRMYILQPLFFTVK